ncbi:MAG: type III-B CRISPR module RAMP protein Cmr4, partial [Anaerolineales bacterium]|nr:type III-B CRISPR module RAMP protein Cmr4 [Anaerolineales bacterium]
VATGLPYLPGSSLKGVMREQSRMQNNGIADTAVFGPETDSILETNFQAASALFSDQRLLLLPVRSLVGTFAWVTSPFILRRLHRECDQIGDSSCPEAIPGPGAEQALIVPNVNQLTLDVGGGVRKLILEDIDLTTSSADKAVQEWANWLSTKIFADTWQPIFMQKFCVVHDDLFSFLLETATEVIARNQLTPEKTSNNLWYEEALPAETVLSGLVLAQQIRKNEATPAEILQQVATLARGMVQLGGNATIGRGLCRIIFPQ